jgi:hypothetical protein
LKINYSYADVRTDVVAKLTYYFDSANRVFGDIISFTDIAEYILDSSIESTTNSFSNVKGLRSLIVRGLSASNYDGDITITPYTATPVISDYPMYCDSTNTSSYDNHLGRVKLSFKQFPMLYTNGCVYNLES